MEILYYTKQSDDSFVIDQNVRWLSVDDYDLFCKHMKLNGQRVLKRKNWEKAYADGTKYCGLFINGEMVCRACVEKYSFNAWEVGDVRTARSYRGKGYAHQVCSFVLKYILQQGKTATIRTEEDNNVMKNVISDLGFSIL